MKICFFTNIKDACEILLVPTSRSMMLHGFFTEFQWVPQTEFQTFFFLVNDAKSFISKQQYFKKYSEFELISALIIFYF